MEHTDYRDFFSSLSNGSRMAIVQLLRHRGATVTQIAEALEFEQSRVSHSLARLQRAGIVLCRWEQKRKMFYLVEGVAPVLHDIESYLEHRTKARDSGSWAAAHWAAATSD